MNYIYDPDRNRFVRIDDEPIINKNLVEVVRCKDCRYFHKYGFKLEYTECLHFDCHVSEDGYCAWGEKMDEVEE